MAEVGDLLRVWRDAAHQLQGVAGSVAGGTTHGARELLDPLLRQSEVIEQLLRHQVELEQRLVGQVIAPAREMADALERTPEVLRAQASGLRAAAGSLSQAAELLDVQATAVEQAVAAVTAPLRLARRGLSNDGS